MMAASATPFKFYRSPPFEASLGSVLNFYNIAYLSSCERFIIPEIVSTTVVTLIGLRIQAS